jgi:manganese-dependent inorganic pyrophosphatase
MQDKIYIIGHKSPDLDSVAAAISYANLKNILEETNRYVPAVAGEANKETKYILGKLSLPEPIKLDSISGKNVILVDHNEVTQSADGISEANVIEIFDHHKLDFRGKDPITVTIKPWGSSCTMIASLYMEKTVAIPVDCASLMLSAILVDTVITKSPTCTETDRNIIEVLSGIANIGDWQEFGMELFKVRSDISEYTNVDIIKSDFKDFILNGNKFGIGQVETADLGQFTLREEELLKEMENIYKNEGYHSVVLFLTDIINVGSKFLVVSSEPEKVEQALGAKLESKKVYIPGIISRKKQVAPKFSEIFG